MTVLLFYRFLTCFVFKVRLFFFPLGKSIRAVFTLFYIIVLHRFIQHTISTSVDLSLSVFVTGITSELNLQQGLKIAPGVRAYLRFLSLFWKLTTCFIP